MFHEPGTAETLEMREEYETFGSSKNKQGSHPGRACLVKTTVNNMCQEGIRNRTEPAEPNPTESFNSGTAGTRRGNESEWNRTEPNRTETMNFRDKQNGSETNRNKTGSFLLI